MKKNHKYIIAISALLLLGSAGLIIANASSDSKLLYEGWPAADKPLRLHILANSDSAEDQQLKLALRDHIIDYLEEITATAADKNAVVEALTEQLPELEERCRSFISRYADYPVTASLSVDQFPAIDYNGSIYAAGEYDALRIVIGSGAGHNWWCVLFPPLCFVDLAAEVDPDAAIAASTATNKTTANGYRLEFKLLHWRAKK